MAKKKSKKAHHTPRRRRMGAAGHHTDILNDAYQVGGVIVAAIAGTMRFASQIDQTSSLMASPAPMLNRRGRSAKADWSSLMIA